MALCPKCKKEEISLEDKEMSRTIDGVQVCGKCYFGTMGELVERHPIVNPTRIRGK